MAAAGEVGVHSCKGFADAAAEASEEEVECSVVSKLVEEGEALAADDLHAREQLAVAVTGTIQLDRRPAAVGVAVEVVALGSSLLLRVSVFLLSHMLQVLQIFCSVPGSEICGNSL